MMWRFDTHQRDLGCPACRGSGHVLFNYSHAYQALKRLRAEGLVGRSCQRDAWGDETRSHVYFAVAVAPDPDDPLEQAFAAPSAEGRDA